MKSDCLDSHLSPSPDKMMPLGKLFKPRVSRLPCGTEGPESTHFIPLLGASKEVTQARHWSPALREQ